MKFELRINRLQADIRARDLAGAILFYSRDIYYYTGTSQPAYLVVLPDDYRLLVRRGYDLARRESGLAAERIQDETEAAGHDRAPLPRPGNRGKGRD